MRLIIAEKPSVAKALAKALHITKKEDGFYAGTENLVSYCFGHLVALCAPDEYCAEWAKWDLAHLPMIPTQWQTTISAKTAKQFRVLQKLMQRNDVDEIICATDADREGELIFRLVYEKARCTKPVKRLWISSLEQSEIHKGMNALVDWRQYDNLAAAARCRAYADWLTGMNLTRLYTVMYSAEPALSCGRVQTPTVNLIVRRQEEIDGFKPQTYYRIEAQAESFSAFARAECCAEAQAIASDCAGQTAEVCSVQTVDKAESPPELYDLTTLQRDANRLFGYSAQQTDDSLQSLYEQQLATYPRTSSRYLLSDQRDTALAVFQHLTDLQIVTALDNPQFDRIINDKKVEGHHAIIPTRQITSEKLNDLPTSEQNILQLIICRLAAAVALPYRYQATTVELVAAGHSFTAKGRTVQDMGYRAVEDTILQRINRADTEEDDSTQQIDENALPALFEGQQVKLLDVIANEQQTRPPSPYTEATLLHAMERAGSDLEDDAQRAVMKGRGLGTPATRADTIEKVIRAGYVQRKKKALIPTDRAKTLMRICNPEVKEPALTAQWEEDLARIEHGELSADEFMKALTTWLSAFIRSVLSMYKPEDCNGIFTTAGIGSCPKCGRPVREFVKVYGCTNKDCDFRMWKEIAHKKISAGVVSKLLKNKRSDLVKGFTSKAGKPFDAYLVFKDDFTVAFEFPDRSKRR